MSNKHSTRHSDVVKHNHPIDIMPKNSSLVMNPSARPVRSVPNSKSTPSQQKGNKLKRKNSVDFDKETMQLETVNFATCSSMDTDAVSQLPVNSSLGEDSEMNNNVAGVSIFVNRYEEKLDCKKHILAETDDISPDYEGTSSRSVLDAINICSPLKSDGKAVSAVNNKLDISLMDNHGGVEAVTDASRNTEIQETYQRLHELRRDNIYGRLRNKTYDSPIVSSKSIRQSRMLNTNLDHPVETLSGGSTKDGHEKELVEGQGSLLQVVEDSGVVMENPRNMEKKTEGCLSKDMPLVASLEQNHEQSERENADPIVEMLGDVRMSHGKAFSDESGKISPDVPVDKDLISPISDMSNFRGGTTQVDKDVKFSLERSLIGSFRKKLLVLDINGLLADVVPDELARYTPDAIISRKAVFKRPFCDDFLQFCFTRFSVGVWSSRMKRNVHLLLDFLMGDAKQKLLFCWDQSHCTWTGFNAVEKKDKPLLVKKLKKLWEKYEPNLPWERGEYNEANTLLLDDTPHKALVNPPHTAIFPHSYQYTDKEDNSLGPGGALQVYLEGLANAENVQKYVEENPFGQRPITEKNLSWRYYQKVIEAISSELEDAPYRYSRVNFHWQENR